MRILTRLYILFFTMLILTGCVEEFDPPSKGYENLLVIEGYLTDKASESEVKISRSIPLDSIGRLPEKGATVRVMDEAGDVFPFTEIKEGTYRIREGSNVVTGKVYTLHVTTLPGGEYVSDPVLMRSTPPIDSITWKFEEKHDLDLKGLQFYVNTHDPENRTWYYRWQWDETWIFSTPFDSDIKWEDNRIIPREENINTCWKSGNSTAINLASSKILDRDVIHNYPLLYVGNNSDRLRARYSLNVKQYALSEESYHYWNELEQVTENLGTLFDPLPSTLKGNIKSVDNENETVLGYFDACTVQEERIFIDNIDLPFMKYPDYFSSCQDTIVSYFLIGEMVLRGWELVKAVPRGLGTGYKMAIPYCVDCTRAGTNVKPDFWE